jgi:hypothetical protein
MLATSTLPSSFTMKRTTTCPSRCPERSSASGKRGSGARPMILAGVTALSTSADVGRETRSVSDARGRSVAERAIESTLAAAEMLGTVMFGIIMRRR